MNLELVIAQEIIQCLQLEGLTPESFPKDALLFGPASEGGLELDSLASLEIIAGLSYRLELPFNDITRPDLLSIKTLVDYVQRHTGG